MTVVWTPTALAQLDSIYDTLLLERDTETAAKWFFKIEAAAAQLEDFPLLRSLIPECAFSEYLPEFTNLRQLIVKPYRIIYDATGECCNILGVLRCSMLIRNRFLREV